MVTAQGHRDGGSAVNVLRSGSGLTLGTSREAICHPTQSSAPECTCTQCVHTGTRMHTCTCVNTHAYMHMYKHTCTCTNTHVHPHAHEHTRGVLAIAVAELSTRTWVGLRGPTSLGHLLPFRAQGHLCLAPTPAEHRLPRSTRSPAALAPVSAGLWPVPWPGRSWPGGVSATGRGRSVVVGGLDQSVVLLSAAACRQGRGRVLRALTLGCACRGGRSVDCSPF